MHENKTVFLQTQNIGYIVLYLGKGLGVRILKDHNEARKRKDKDHF
jgi:hypothetical protein